MNGCSQPAAAAQVLDETAFTLCKENDIPVVVFDLHRDGNIVKAVQGADGIGTVVDAQPDLASDLEAHRDRNLPEASEGDVDTSGSRTSPEASAGTVDASVDRKVAEAPAEHVWLAQGLLGGGQGTALGTAAELALQDSDANGEANMHMVV